MDENEYAMRSLQVLCAPGAGYELLLREPADGHDTMLLWLPALGVPARQYLSLARALSEHGIGSALHEWRGLGSSSVRASRVENWGYRQLLEEDVAAAVRACRRTFPRARLMLGGHSLGAQLACLYAGLHPDQVQGLVVVASGTPYWRCFPSWSRSMRVAVGLVDWIARLRGYFPGRKLGFGGNEARGVMADWSRSARTGRYTATGMQHDLEGALSGQPHPLLALRLEKDALVPSASLRYLLAKMPRAPSETQVLDDAELGTSSDHFSWMKSPAAVAGRIADWTRRLT